MTNYLGELAERMNIRVDSLSPEQAIISMPVEGNRQGAGRLHGGANGMLVEHAASILAHRHSPEGKTPVGTELNVSQLKGATQGRVTATATLLSQTRSSLCAEVKVHDEEGALTAAGRLTLVFINAQ